jgi:hypothetical protein
MRQLHQVQCNLLYRRDVLKVNQLKVASQDAFANQFCGQAFLGLSICIKSFLHAGAAIGPMGTFKAATQTGMAMVAITEAIARHLVQN